MRRGFIQKKLYHLAPLPQYRHKTHYLVLKTWEASNILVDDKNILCVSMRFEG